MGINADDIKAQEATVTAAATGSVADTQKAVNALIAQNTADIATLQSLADATTAAIKTLSDTNSTLSALTFPAAAA